MDAVNWHGLFFLLFAMLACGFALAVVFTANVVRMAFYLVLSLSATAGLFFLAGADFVGTMQLVLYVGGTVVLLIFGVMLTAQSPFISIKTSGGDWVLATLVGGSMLAVLLPTAMGIGRAESNPVGKAYGDQTTQVEPTATRIGLGLLGVRVDKLQEQDRLLRGGMSGYLLPFEIISIHLLVVLIGAAYLARAKRKAQPKFPNT